MKHETALAEWVADHFKSDQIDEERAWPNLMADVSDMTQVGCCLFFIFLFLSILPSLFSGETAFRSLIPFQKNFFPLEVYQTRPHICSAVPLGQWCYVRVVRVFHTRCAEILGK